jgi:hypothetical protein
MVGKAKSNASLSATIGYNTRESSTFFFSNRLEGDEIRSFKWQMADLHRCYDGTGSNLILHAQLSPEPEEGRQMETES